MISTRLASDGDGSSWDAYVRRQPDASPYHLMAWLQAVETAYRHQSLCLIAERSNNIVGVLPMCRMALPFSRGHICSLPYCDVGSCLADSDAARENLLDAAFDIARRYKVSRLQFRSRRNSKSPSQAQLDGKVSMFLPLPDAPEKLFDGFKSKLRSQIRKASKNGLTFRSGRSARELGDFYRVLSTNMRDLGSPVHSRCWFESIQSSYGEDMIIGITSYNGQPVGAGMLLFLGQHAAIPWASTISEYNRFAPNMLLYWNLLKFSVERGCTVFDFGRSNHGEGTYRFKKQWGAAPVALSWDSYRVDGKMIAEASGRQLPRIAVEYVWRRLPIAVANRLGPSIRKHVAL